MKKLAIIPLDNDQDFVNFVSEIQSVSSIRSFVSFEVFSWTKVFSYDYVLVNPTNKFKTNLISLILCSFNPFLQVLCYKKRTVCCTDVVSNLLDFYHAI